MGDIKEAITELGSDMLDFALGRTEQKTIPSSVPQQVQQQVQQPAPQQVQQPAPQPAPQQAQQQAQQQVLQPAPQTAPPLNKPEPNKTNQNAPMVQIIQNSLKDTNSNGKYGQNNNNSSNNILTILNYITSYFNLNKLNLVNFDLNNLFMLLILYYVIFIFTKDFIKGLITTVLYTGIITYTIIRVYNYIYTIS